MLLNMKELLIVADEHKFAVPAFNISSYSMFNGIIDISEQKNAPVIIEIHPDELKHIGTDAIFAMTNRAYRSDVPVVIHLDHGSSLGDVMAAIRAGFTSVMIDGSSLPFEENAALCRKIVEAAHAAINYICNTDSADWRKTGNDNMVQRNYTTTHFARNISVEGELGNIGVTDENKIYTQEIHYTQPEEAVKFIKETGVDALAIAIGTCHGLYPKGYIPQLKLELLKDIKKAIREAGLDTVLVLHGGSNNPDEEITESIKLGIAKINISSDIKVAYYTKMREVLQNKGLREPSEIEPPCIKAMQEVAGQKMDLFGATGKAVLYK
jgi:fructose-bisphosphate aldolase class II